MSAHEPGFFLRKLTIHPGDCKELKQSKVRLYCESDELEQKNEKGEEIWRKKSKKMQNEFV